jgi:guanylate kinase
MKGNLFILSGPSGVGKNAVENQLKKLVPELKRVLTTTTREPRPYEQNGVHYNFISKEKFEQLIEDDSMFEWAQVHSNLYGSQKKDIEAGLEAGDQLLMIIDVQGAIDIKKNHQHAHLLFIEPESLDQLKERISRRPNIDEAELKVRLQSAEKELALKDSYDYSFVNKERKLRDTAKEIAQTINKIIEA